MKKILVEDQTLEAVAALDTGEYDQCTFLNCDLANADLSRSQFFECTFVGCNLSLAQLTETALRDVRFKDCKLLGLRFETCSELLFAVSFEDCTLNFASFFRLKMPATQFKNCVLQEVDFAETDLSSTVFANCDLAGATFDNTNLEKADLRTAFNYHLDPDNNRLRKARFSLPGVVGLLDKYGIVVE